MIHVCYLPRTEERMRRTRKAKRAGRMPPLTDGERWWIKEHVRLRLQGLTDEEVKREMGSHAENRTHWPNYWRMLEVSTRIFRRWGGT
jgi:hypothetical protein